MKGDHSEFKDSYLRWVLTIRLTIRYFMVNLYGQLEGFKQAPTLGKELTPQPVTTLCPPLH